MEVLDLVLRWLHILPAIALVGGLIFWRMVYLPASGDGAASESLNEAVRSRWAKVVMISAALLILSGLYNSATEGNQPAVAMAYNALLGVKILLALVIFFFASVLAGRSENAAKFRQREPFWLNLNLVLAIALVCIAGFLKVESQKAPKKERDEDQQQSQVTATAAELAEYEF